jgi:hypothetical protein
LTPTRTTRSKARRQVGEDESPPKSRTPATRSSATRIEETSTEEDEDDEIEEEDSGSSSHEMTEESQILQQRLEKYLSDKRDRVRNWCRYEFFYPTIDRGFFAHNEFQDCLNEMGLAKVTKLTRFEWGCVRTSMGKCRRFSPAFIKEEMKKLHDHRTQFRRNVRGYHSF